MQVAPQASGTEPGTPWGTTPELTCSPGSTVATSELRSIDLMIAWRKSGLAKVGLARFMPKNCSAPSGACTV